MMDYKKAGVDIEAGYKSVELKMCIRDRSWPMLHPHSSNLKQTWAKQLPENRKSPGLLPKPGDVIYITTPTSSIALPISCLIYLFPNSTHSVAL